MKTKPSHYFSVNTPRRRGFSLLELTCALFVVTVGVFGVLQMYTLTLEHTRVLKEYALARSALQNEMETLRALPFAVLQEGPAQPFRSVTPGLEKLVNVKTAVSIIDRSEGGTGLKEVRVTLRWTGEHGRLIEKSLATFIADKG